MDRKSAGELQKHMLGTYYTLRIGLAGIGIALPIVVLLAGGVLHHVWLEPSLSQYYYTAGRLRAFTTRDLFVGGLFAAGACLYLYKGFSTKENIALNLAGIFAILVALLPTAPPSSAGYLVSKLHGASAVLLFLCIAYVSLFRSRDTLPLLSVAKQRRYSRLYRATGIAMIVSPLGAVALAFLLEPASRFRTLIFWVETLAVWAFAAYWILKTMEMRETKAEQRGLDAELRREIVTGTPGGEPAPVLVGSAPTATAMQEVVPKTKEMEVIIPADAPTPAPSLP